MESTKGPERLYSKDFESLADIAAVFACGSKTKVESQRGGQNAEDHNVRWWSVVGCCGFGRVRPGAAEIPEGGWRVGVDKRQVETNAAGGGLRKRDEAMRSELCCTVRRLHRDLVWRTTTSTQEKRGQDTTERPWCVVVKEEEKRRKRWL